ncbi:GTP binding protein beta 1 [Actinidia rufa]|uniref:GTP binding protein beta 1 n=1 Tax=Actinidia rufa TaxID=165716 RepID=A0A7J0ETX5_9ERIC|nr:GTP binding protein beta 1 [Actinidia rufa]
MSVVELKERHVAATETVDVLRDRLKHRRLLLLDTDVAGYARSQGKTPVSWGPTDLVCCRTLQGHTGKLGFAIWANTGSNLLGVSVPFFSWLNRPEILVAVAEPKCRKWKLTFPLSTTFLEAMAICVNLKLESRIKTTDVILLWAKWCIHLIGPQKKNRIVSASQDGRLIVWNALTSQKTHAIKLPCAWVMTCAFSPTGQSVACGGLDSVCSIFSLNSPTDRDGNLPVARMLSGHKGYVSCCQYVLDEDTHLITSSGDKTCILWDITTGVKTSVFGGEFQSGHTGDVLSVSINGSNPRMFVSGSCDGTARLWDTRVASRAVRTFHSHEADVNAVKFFPDGNRFGTGSDDGICKLFDIRTGHQLQVYYQQRSDNDVPPVTSIAFSISGRLLFAGYSNGDCYVWDTLLAEVVLNLGSLQNSHTAQIRSAVWVCQLMGVPCVQVVGIQT